ncbi:hypothetical protein [Pseudanabaena sp. PCC 6802]|uniref:hypothetical protein n=1 Tax=Pseudanabaena sp. PCC 6802 TaxID=118173 RepID=UPI000344B611|nr:hypothetical protein [Pseudanabaena sp. PCC 6802]
MTNKDGLPQDFLDLSADGADIAIDLLTESELLKDIPVAGLVYIYMHIFQKILRNIFLL